MIKAQKITRSLIEVRKAQLVVLERYWNKLEATWLNQKNRTSKEDLTDDDKNKKRKKTKKAKTHKSDKLFDQ